MAAPPSFQEQINKTELNYEEFVRRLNEKQPDIAPQDLTGKVVIVTGANVGIGFETAKALATMNPAVLILACRNLEKANSAAAKIKEVAGKDTSVETALLDLASYASVKSFAKSFLSRNLPLDILVSNAAISTRDWVVTGDGHEIIVQVNHIANVLLVLLLTPALRKAASPRIVVVASDVHYWAARPTPDHPNPVTHVATVPPEDPSQNQYFASKLLNTLFAAEYARRAPFPAKICSTNPSYTESELGQKEPTTGESKPVNFSLGIPKRTTYEGAKTIIHAAITPEIVNGGYYSEMKDTVPRSWIRGEVGKQFAENVWRDTIAILNKVVEPGTFESWVEA